MTALRRFVSLAMVAAVAAVAMQISWGAPWKGKNPWSVDYDKSLRQARKEEKIMLLNFMGNMKTNKEMERIHHELLLSPDFYGYAEEHGIILVDIVVDADRAKKRDLHGFAQETMKKYKVEGYPLILFATSGEEELGRTGYIAGGPKAYFELFDQWRSKATVEPGPEDSASPDRQQRPIRSFTDASGRAIEARLLSIDGDQITIERKDGRRFQLSIEKLSEADQAYVKEQK